MVPFPELNTILLDFACSSQEAMEWKQRFPEKRLLLQLPKVLREKRAASVKQLAQTALLLDGVVLSCFDELGLWKEVLREQHPGEESRRWQIIGDAMLYTYNTNSVSFYKSLFPEMQFLLPDELTDRELFELTDSAVQAGLLSEEDLIYKIYGYQELMITAQCLQRNEEGCLNGSAGKVLMFTDEKDNRFFSVPQCSQCCSIIYNGQPTVMFDKMEKDKRSFPNLLLDFTMEAPEEVLRILEGYLKGKTPAEWIPTRLTRGHHFKGVE